MISKINSLYKKERERGGICFAVPLILTNFSQLKHKDIEQLLLIIQCSRTDIFKNTSSSAY
uniref:Uncharacterized protein n=1 Tax=Rhizophora mucronata TaxID=61149 RepID=A0A2P2NJB1_RHIMU